MSGYSRQSAASIVPTAVVRATPINDEFNALRDAFVVATGHKHDGTATEGAYIPTISDTNNRNKVVVDSANNRISLFVNVSSSAAEQLRIVDGAIIPVVDDDIDLGSSSFEFKNLFIDGTANIDSLIADTASIAAGSINNTVIGNSTPAAGTFTTVTANVSATIASATISGGTINSTVIGGTTPAAGTFTNLTVNSAATIASAAISAGTINGTVIGGSSPAAITGTNITANTGFSGNLTGNVTGNVTAGSGTSTFNNATVNGTLTATLTGNVTATTGTSTFNNVTITGGLNMDAGTAATITNLTTPTNTNDAATKGYVDTSIANLIDTAPGTLDTLNELAAALGDDPNFATTVTNEIATKLALAGGTMSGAIAMGTNKITGVGDPTANQDAATKVYVDTQRDTRLALSGGTMSGAIAMGTNKITGLGDPTANQDAATKVYVDGILGSATSAAASAAAAATSASNAATSASNAATSESNAAASASAAAASFDSFDDRYLGPKSSNPTLDNDGNALLTGALYFNTTAGEMRVWNGSAWLIAYLPASGYATLTGSETLTNKTISADNNTLSGIAASSFVLSNASGNIDGAAAQKAIPSGVVVGTTDSQTLTNKTAVAPVFLASTTTTQDGVIVTGRAGGTSSFRATIAPTTLSASRSITLPDANIDFTTGLGVAQGGTGRNTLTANNVILGNGTSAVQLVAPGTSGNVLTSNGTTWVSQAAGAALTGTTQSTSPFKTALGAQAGTSATGVSSVYVGYQAGRVVTTGDSNTAIGADALYSAVSTSETVAVGRGALYSYTQAAGGATAVGSYSLYSATTGHSNTAFGYYAGITLTTGIQNVMMGMRALYSTTTGSYSVALGYEALYNSTADRNTAIGFEAGRALTTGVNNTLIGYQASASSTTVSNEFTLGNSSIATLRCQVTTITSLSDARDKANISDLPAGLTFVKALRPVEFDWNMRDGGKVGEHDTGFIAQDLKAAQESTGVNIPGLVYEANPDRLEAGYGKLIPVLVKAIQELNAKVESLEAQLKGN